MSRSALLLFLLAFLFGTLAMLAWWGAGVPYQVALDHLNAVAPDGDVESYSAHRHELLRLRLRFATAGLAAIAFGLAFWAWRLRRTIPDGAQSSAVFFSDMREVIGRYGRRTSSTHKTWVGLLILGAALLRIWMLFAPITYDEAFTWTYYASRPWHVALADYSYPNNHILHTLSVKVSTGLFGVSTLSLRLPAFFASLLVLPLFYLFVRSTFNRYIALLALALVAADGSLVEYGALARGYSITWLCMITALVFTRHFLRSGNGFTAFLIGLICALGMWAVPTMLYPALLVYFWASLLTLTRHRVERSSRLRGLLFSFVLFCAATMLLYLPVLVLYGPAQLSAHPELPVPTWEHMTEDVGGTVLALWAYLADPAPALLVFAGVLGLVYAAYVSVKYRLLIVALLLATVPVVLIQRTVAPERAWLFTLFILHLGSAIGLFHFLKLVQERLFSGLGKRTRVTAAAFVLFTAFAITGIPALDDRHWRFTEAPEIAIYFDQHLQLGDRVYTLFPWEAPVEFHAVEAGIQRSLFHKPGQPGSRVFVVVVPTFGQSLGKALEHHGADTTQLGSFKIVKEIGRTKIFAAPFGTRTEL